MICLPHQHGRQLKRDSQIFGQEATKVHAATQIHSRLLATNETLQENIEIFNDLVIHTTGADPTLVMCQVTIVLFIRHRFNEQKCTWHEDFKTCHDPSSRSINQTKKYKGLNEDDPSIMQVITVLHLEVLAVQGQSSLPADSNQI